jgi:hypothetical protein
MEGKEKKNGQAIRLLGCPEEKKREDSFLFLFLFFFFFFTFLIKCYIINACGLKGSNI